MGKDGKNERRLRRWKWGRRRRWSEEEGATGSMLSGKMVTWQVNKVMIKNTEVLRPFGVNFCGTVNFSYQSSGPKKCLKGNKKERERERKKIEEESRSSASVRRAVLSEEKEKEER